MSHMKHDFLPHLFYFGLTRRKLGPNNLPSAFSITLALFPSMTATHELVVPKSIPMMLFDKKIRSNKVRHLRREVSRVVEN